MCHTKRRIKKLLKFMLLLLLSLLITPSNFFAGEAERNFVLTVKDNLISLKAKDAPLKEVLEDIGRRMKIDVLASIPDNQKITAEFEKLSLEEAVKRLSTNYSLLTDSTKGGRRITKVVILDKGNETALSRPTAQEPAMRKEEKPVSKVKAEAVKTVAPQPEPFKFEFDPSKYGEKRR